MKIFFLTAMFAAFASTTWANEHRELFVQKYKAVFGEIPSDEVWNLGKNPTGTSFNKCQTRCNNGCSHL